MHRSSARQKPSRPTRSGTAAGLKVTYALPSADPARQSGGVFTVPLPRGARLKGLRPRLFELQVRRAFERIATLPDEEVAAELKRVEGELSTPKAHDRDGPDADGDAALQRAYARGDETKEGWASRGDLLTGEHFAAAVGLSRATVDNRRRAGQLLALELGAKRGVRYPAWQRGLLAEASRRAAFERVLAALPRNSAASAARFFTQASPALDGRTPIEALMSGDAAAVLRAAKTWARSEQGGG